MTKPVRLLESGELPQAERALLEAGRALPPVPYDVTAGAARFRSALDGLAPGGGGAPAPVGTSGGASATAASTLTQVASLAKLALFVIVPMLGVLAGYHVLRSPSSAPGVIVAPVSAPAAAPVVAMPQPDLGVAGQQPLAAVAGPAAVRASGAADATTQAAAEAAPRPAPRIAGAGSRRKATVHEADARAPRQAAAAREISARVGSPLERDDLHAEPQQAPQPAAERVQAPQEKPAPPQPTAASVTSARAPEPPAQIDELQGIARARSLLRHDPDAALALLDRIAREHPRGYFVEERMGLTVLALAGAGKEELTEQRGKAFLRAYPSSPYADRVRAVLAR